MTQCVWLDQAGESIVTLRRYVSASEKACPERWGYHNASSGEIARVPTVLKADPERPHGPLDLTRGSVEEPPHDDPRWPPHCPCGYPFADDDEWQVNTDRLYRRQDTGELVSLRDAPAGAMWDAFWMPERMRGPDGRSIVVRLPNGRDWMPDSPARNCTRPGEDHDCWCRHGEPPNLTVDKTPEPGRSTCQAGAGSIASGTAGEPGYWHGFLRGGLLVD